MKRIILLICVIFMPLLMGCSQRYVIPEEEMGNIYHDLFLLDRYLSDDPDSRFQTDSMFVYESVFEKYGYSSDEFLDALDQYFRHPEDLLEIMENVQARMKTEYDQITAEIDSAGNGGIIDFDKVQFDKPRSESRSKLKLDQRSDEFEVQNANSDEKESVEAAEEVSSTPVGDEIKVQRLNPKELKKKKKQK